MVGTPATCVIHNIYRYITMTVQWWECNSQCGAGRGTHVTRHIAIGFIFACIRCICVDRVQYKLFSLTELPMYKNNKMNGKYPQHTCTSWYCKMKNIFYCVRCSDLDNGFVLWWLNLTLQEIASINGCLNGHGLLLRIMIPVHHVSQYWFHCCLYLDFCIPVLCFGIYIVHIHLNFS